MSVDARERAMLCSRELASSRRVAAGGGRQNSDSSVTFDVGK